jgi:hypothetical protein
MKIKKEKENRSQEFVQFTHRGIIVEIMCKIKLFGHQTVISLETRVK